MHRSLRLLALTATSALTAALLTSPPAMAALANAQADVLTGAPQVGQCYDVTRQVAYEDASVEATPVDCSQSHTLWVTAVAEIPAEIPIDSTDKAYGEFANSVCLPSIKPVLGDNRLKFARSAYGSFNFHATDAQQAEGARWLVCTVGIVGSVKTLVSSTKATPAKVTGKLPTKLQLCGSARYDRVNCSAPHVYRATWATVVDARISTAQKVADRTCPRHVSSQTWMWSSRGISSKQFLLTCLTR